MKSWEITAVVANILEWAEAQPYLDRMSSDRLKEARAIFDEAWRRDREQNEEDLKKWLEAKEKTSEAT